MPKQEKFDLDPTSPKYVGRLPKDIDKHNVRDALRLLEAVQQYYLAGETVPTERLAQAAQILSVASDRLYREVAKRVEFEG